VAPVYIDGEKAVTLKGDHIAEEFQALVDDYVRKNYAPGADTARHRQRKKEIPIKVIA
jgi:(E)-4-hydroxy-3-methylbut-2-enyl-diphosphate synthase